MGRFVTTTLLLFAFYFIFGQNEVSIHFQRLTSHQNLSQNYISCIFQDKTSYIWIGTFNGLNRYNGQKFERYLNNPSDSTSLPSNDIKIIYQDYKDRLWMGSHDGICRYDGKTNSFVRFPNADFPNFKLLNNEVRAIYVDSTDNIWVGTYGGGITFYNPNLKTITNYSIATQPGISPLSDFINCFFVDTDGKLWVGTENGGIATFNVEGKQFENCKFADKPRNVLNTAVINCIIEDKSDKNILWIGTWNNGLIRYNKSTQSMKKYSAKSNLPNHLNNNTIRTIEQDNRGNLWLGTFGGGLNYFNPKSEKFTAFVNNPADPSSLSYNLLWCSLLDRSGLLWLGSFGGGLNKGIIGNQNIVHVQASNNASGQIANNSVSALCIDHKGMVWMGTIGGGISLYNSAIRAYDNELKGLETGEVVRDIYEDSHLRIWIATENGLYLYNYQKKKLTAFSQELIDKPVYCIFEDSGHNIWLGTFDEGIFKLDEKDSFNPDPQKVKLLHYSHQESDTNSLISNRVWCIYEDAENNIWLGTFNGLDRWNKTTGTFSHYAIKADQNSNPTEIAINTILEDSSENLWLGTNGNGLARLNKTTGKINWLGGPKVVYGLIPENNNQLWLSSDAEGLFRFNSKTGTYKNYTSLNGFQDEVYERKAYGKLPSGKLVFGGTHGVDIFHPDSITDNDYNPPVVITDFKLFNISATGNRIDKRFTSYISELKHIKLSHKENIFTIEFACLDYLAPEKRVYAYKLEGFNQNWVYTDAKNNNATYTNLDGGTYIFKAAMVNNGVIDLSTTAQIEIVVSPPFWKTIWFRILVLLGTTGFIVLGVRLRINALKQQKIELERQVNLKTVELTRQKEKLEHSNEELQKQKEEIISQRDHLKEMTEQVDEANTKKISFFTNISHELRTPLTLLIGPVNRLINSLQPDADVKNDLLMIQRNALRLKKLVNQLMDFRKIETGTMPLNISENDIIDFISSIKDTFNDIARQYHINYSLFAFSNSIRCWFDADKIEKITYNLLSNAFKYTSPNDTIKIWVQEYPGFENDPDFNEIIKKQQLKPVGKLVEIVVSDTGKGIAVDKLDKIFNRFYQIEYVKASMHESTGIGLAMTKDLIDLHKGMVEVTSELGKGSLFRVVLPVSKEFYLVNNMETCLNLNNEKSEISSIVIPEDYNKTVPKEKAIHSSNNSMTNQILIVDDNADLRTFLKSCFKDNFEIIEAENGANGIEFAIKYQPSIIISDVMMPVIDGNEMCRTLKQKIETSHIPIILLTARALHEQQVEGLETGADDYITKPFDSEILLLKVRNIIETRSRMANAFRLDINTKPTDLTTNPIDQKFVEQANRIILDNLNNPDFNVDEFTREMGLGRTIFYQKIKKLTNLSVNDFIITVKLKKAAEYMKTSDLRISEICYETGFSSPRYFATCFKKQLGMTPTEFIQSLKK